MKKILVSLLMVILMLFPLSISVLAQNAEVAPEITMEHNMSVEDRVEFDEDEELDDFDDHVFGYDTETEDGIVMGDNEVSNEETETMNTEEVEELMNEVEGSIGKIFIYIFILLIPFIVFAVIIIVVIVVIVKRKRKKQ